MGTNQRPVSLSRSCYSMLEEMRKTMGFPKANIVFSLVDLVWRYAARKGQTEDRPTREFSWAYVMDEIHRDLGLLDVDEDGEEIPWSMPMDGSDEDDLEVAA